MKLGELFIQLGIQAEATQAIKFNTAITAVSTSFLALKQAANLAIETLERFVTETVRGTLALENFNKQTDLSVASLQKWQVAGKLSNTALSFEQIAASVQTLQNNLTEIQLGKGNINPFAMLEINTLGKNAFQVLDDVRDRIKGLNSAIATNIIQEMGLSPEFINILRLSDQEFAKINEQLLLTGQQRGSILKLNNAIAMTQIKLQLLKDQAVAKLAPILEKLLINISNFLSKHSKEIITLLQVLPRGLIGLIVIFERVFSLISRITDAFFRMIGAAKGIETLIPIIIALTVAFSPLTATIVGLLLLLDDISVYLQGGDSVIGRIIKALPNIVKPFESIAKAAEKIHLNVNPGGFIANPAYGGASTPIIPFLPNTSNVPTLNSKDIALPKLPSTLPSYGGTPTNIPKSVTQNNTFNISSNAKNGEDVAEGLKPILISTLSQINRGTM